MGFEVIPAEAKGTVIADRRLWTDADQTRLVEDGDPAAAHLFAAGPGAKVDARLAEKLGYQPAGSVEDPLAEESMKSLGKRARDLDIPGRSSMDREELIEAIREAESE